MSEYPCDDPKCCCNGPIEIDYENAIQLDLNEVLKYKEKYGSWYLGQSRAILEYYRKNGPEKDLKLRKMVWRRDVKTHRYLITRAFFRGFKRGLLLPFTGGKTYE